MGCRFPVRAWRTTALVAGLVYLLSFGSVRADGDEWACAGDRASETGTADLLEDALQVLRQCGHDPRDYRLEIRREDPSTPDFPDPRATRVTSVIFWPEQNEERYAVRVNTVEPCVLTWVWQPAAFTGWQRRVLDRAAEAARQAGVEWAESDRREVQVLESKERIGVRVWSDGTDEPVFRFTMGKSDLLTVDP